MKKMNRIISALLVLVTLVSMMSVSSITASATEGYYEVNGSDMDIYYNPYGMEIPSSVDYLYIYDAILNEPLDFEDSNVTYLMLRNCTLNMSQLGNLDKIDSVVMINCELKDLTFLSQCTGITYLDIDCCYMASLNGIQYLKKLEYLWIYDVGIESIEPLKHNKKLEELTLCNTCVTDLSPIENMNIQELDISNTLSIRDLSTVMTLDNLKKFDSDNCEMAYTEELSRFIKRNRIENDMSDDWEEIQESVKETADILFTPYMSDEEKIETTVEYVVDIMEYDYRVEYDDDLSMEYNDNALSYAIKGEGVCRNYSALTMVLLQEAGIEIYEIKGPNHIWNIIDLGDEFYWLDVTWLDGDDDFTNSPYYMANEFYFFGHEDAYTMPSSMYRPDYSPAFIFTICAPSKTSIRYKDGITLHTSFDGGQFYGVAINWTSNNDNFDVTYNDDSTITIISDSNGYTYFTAELVDEYGNVIATDTIEMQSKAGFFDKIGGFFRSLFGATKIYEY